ncbi:hypothetical protein BDZ91DRAFT_721506 [Kalaharituber pfeilii]|nr:hypothetical protein BDZ91DRAFT_721506 [Kalaharituber pfeilii]
MTSMRTVSSRTISRIVSNCSPRDVRNATFPPQRQLGLSHPTLLRQGMSIPWATSQARLRPSQRCFTTASTSPPTGRSNKRPVSPHIGFYQMFGRPLLKVFLMAFITYQMAYWVWLKLVFMEEQHDKKEQRR